MIKICPNLVLWRKVTRRKGEDRGLFKKQWKSRRHRQCIERRSVLLFLLAIYIQSVYPKIVIKNLYATPPSLFVPSAPPLHCVYLRSLRDSVCLLYRLLVYYSIFRKNLIKTFTERLICHSGFIRHSVCQRKSKIEIQKGTNSIRINALLAC